MMLTEAPLEDTVVGMKVAATMLALQLVATVQEVQAVATAEERHMVVMAVDLAHNRTMVVPRQRQLRSGYVGAPS